ncbi:MAG: hypothetical protein V4751_02060 [Pseudomonadota bacterium]
MQELEKLTTEYVDNEDRIRLSGQLRSGETVALWVTQRLVNRLLPHLFTALENHSDKGLPNEIVQSFALQAAKAELVESPPVLSSPKTLSWLVDAVDISVEATSVKLRFRGRQQEQVGIAFQPVQLRQWLSILHSVWGIAQWQGDIWPEWIASEKKPMQQPKKAALH